jgi:hypothetical protein
MANKQIEFYVFTPGITGTGNIKIPGFYRVSEINKIYNATRGVNIWEKDAINVGLPSQGALGGVSFSTTDTASFGNYTVNGVTTIFPTNPTTGMSSTDNLYILVEDPDLKVRPYDFGTDAIERMRVSTPQALIDADFEYGLQSTKWQTYTDLANTPSIYEVPGFDITVNSVTTNTSQSSVITVTTSASHGLSVGNPFTMFGLDNGAFRTSGRAEGSFIINSIPSANTFTYTAKGTVSGSIISTSFTQLRRGQFYSGSQLNLANITSDGASPSVITVQTVQPHGLYPGSTIIASVTSSGVNHSLASGSFSINIINSGSFAYTASVGGAVASAGLAGRFYTRNDSFNIHRPFDGGIILGTNSPAHGARILRQSKKYFRYQSGKGLLYTTGTLFCPNLDIESVSASGVTPGSTIWITGQDEHNISLTDGSRVVLTGITTPGYNGEYTVSQMINEYIFAVTATGSLGTTNAVLGQQPRFAVKNWHGATIRAGITDDQNGIFYEYDGQTLYAVQRKATFQLAGTVSMPTGSNIVTGSVPGARFDQQCKPGDKIVLRGMTYQISKIFDSASMAVTPQYRGLINLVGSKASLVVDKKIPQSQWNIDKADGTGPSGYNFNLTKMQMIGIQYTWYGAGFIDWMTRGPEGNFIMLHREKNNNVNDEAFMRSGNLCVRYEVNNEGPYTALSQSITNVSPANGGSLLVRDATYFPNSTASVYVDDEIITYRGKSGNNLLNITRGANLPLFTNGISQSFNAGPAVAHNSGSGVILLSNTCSPTVSHWGSAVIMDGGFDSDRGYFFNFSRNNIIVNAGATQQFFLIRLAPSVSNSLIGNLGDRELINRSQLLLRQISITSTQNCQVSLLLNPQGLTGINWFGLNTTAQGSQPSLGQVSTAFSGTGTPGEQIFSAIASANTTEYQDLSALKELSNSVNGGSDIFPDGPDVLLVRVQNLNPGVAATASVNLYWNESQA